MTDTALNNPQPAVSHPPRGSRYWRSLAEYADSPAFRAKLADEFQGYNPDDLFATSRRGFLKLAGASMALAGLTLTGCRRWPEENLAPFANRPGGHMPGTSQYYATLYERGGVAIGILAEAFDGRPIKVEGNPLHPYSLGATDAYTQATILEMYDPERSRTPLHREGEGVARATWEAFESFMGGVQVGAGFAVLAEPSNSPSLARLREALVGRGVAWYDYEPLHRDFEIEGARLAFGRPVRPQLDLGEAKIIVSFECDLLNQHPASLRYSRAWAAGRRSADQGTMNRMYVAESAFTTTGSVADERLPVRSIDIAAVVAAVASGVGVQAPAFTLPPSAKSFVDNLVRDLQANRGASVLVAGPSQPAEVHALVWQINAALGNIGQTLSFLEEPQLPGGTGRGHVADIAALVEAMNAGRVQTLLILGGNPVYDAPADLRFGEALAKVANSIHLSLYYDETSEKCAWHLPRAHYLESWGDGRAWDGTVSVQQPIILPLFEGRSPIEVVAAVLGEQQRAGYDIVRATFQGLLPQGDDFERSWRRVLHDGILEGSTYAEASVTPQGAPAAAPAAADGGDDRFEITFQADDKLFDGRYANNGWLQELPGPLTKLTWDNAAWINIADARERGIEQGEIITIKVGDASIEIPAYLMPGQARKSIALPLGYGRTAGSMSIGREVGANVYPLRRSTASYVATGATVASTGARHELAVTTEHHLIDWVGERGRNERVGTKGKSGLVVKEATLPEYQKKPGFVRENEHGDYTLQMFDTPLKVAPAHPGAPQYFAEPHAWGMAIDMSACTGCSACVIACQAENNVPVVGKANVLDSREMHWLRIDRYFKTEYTDDHGRLHSEDPDAQNPQVVHQPMLCVHCEMAPCEEVCPVNASVHDTEGLNVQIYNRCIGTRYCSNNCPYKVRRFNYYDWHSKYSNGELNRRFANPWLGMPDSQQRNQVDPIRQMMFNPDVTVRMRGVMEKCTFCTQRIAGAKIAAKIEWQNGQRNEPLVQDGEILTACQQACPTEAIVFGNLNDPDSRVSQLHKSNRTYAVLADLNTRPRAKHMAKIRNPATT